MNNGCTGPILKQRTERYAASVARNVREIAAFPEITATSVGNVGMMRRKVIRARQSVRALAFSWQSASPKFFSLI
jgi:hypothetical protein